MSIITCSRQFKGCKNKAKGFIHDKPVCEKCREYNEHWDGSELRLN